MSKPILINLESSTDASGKATIAKKLKETLEAQGKKVLMVDFPRYGDVSASLVENYLRAGDICIKNSEVSKYLSDGVVEFTDGTTKSLDYFFSKEEIKRIRKIEFSGAKVTKNVFHKYCDEFRNVLCDYDLSIPRSNILISKRGKILGCCKPPHMFKQEEMLKVRETLLQEAEKVDESYDEMNNTRVFKYGTNPNHIAKALLYTVDRNIWYTNMFDEIVNGNYDYIISDRSYMSNVFYRTEGMSDTEVLHYLILVYYTEIIGSKINSLFKRENIHNILLTHSNFDFAKNVIIKRAEESGQPLDETEKDFDYQKRVFVHSRALGLRIEKIKRDLIFMKIGFSSRLRLNFLQTEAMNKFDKYFDFSNIFEYFNHSTQLVSDENGWIDTDEVVRSILKSINTRSQDIQNKEALKQCHLKLKR